MNTNRIKFMNTYFDSVSKKEALELFEVFIHEGVPRIVTAPNTDMVVRMQDNPELAKIMNEADLILTDGQIIRFIAKFLGTPIKERLTITYFIWDILKMCEEKGYSIYVFGGMREYLSKAIAVIQERLPNLKVLGYKEFEIQDKLDKQTEAQIVSEIRDLHPDILLVGLGCPRQELFISKNKQDYNVPVSLTIGGCMDYIAGRTKCAPQWMRNAGLEWFFRFMQEPKRLFKRYFVTDMVIFKLALKYKFKK